MSDEFTADTPHGTTTVDKEWAAMAGDEILYQSTSELEVRRWVWHEGLGPDDCDILALPKPYGSVIL